ncbi:hypothetical protein BU17DRAFT_103449 [Hysterangium stoloniferum]|nr:hypothetical protein BU17DRAFT_103449 [Hysterangium stoloniferum]
MWKNQVQIKRGACVGGDVRWREEVFLHVQGDFVYGQLCVRVSIPGSPRPPHLQPPSTSSHNPRPKALPHDSPPFAISLIVGITAHFICPIPLTHPQSRGRTTIRILRLPPPFSNAINAALSACPNTAPTTNPLLLPSTYKSRHPDQALVSAEFFPMRRSARFVLFPLEPLPTPPPPNASRSFPPANVISMAYRRRFVGCQEGR